MTRVVVIGPFPPTADPLGDVVLARVRLLRAEGLSVDVVSSEPSAAPSHGRPDSLVGAARIARVVRRADRVLWFPDRGVGGRPAWPLRRALAATPRVERMAPEPSRGGGPPAGREPSGARAASSLVRWRAGAPTALRSLRSRAARARSGR